MVRCDRCGQAVTAPVTSESLPTMSIEKKIKTSRLVLV